MSITVQVLANAATATGAQLPRSFPYAGAKTFQASMTVTSGSGSATVGIEGSLDGSAWDQIGTLSPTDTAPDSISFAGCAYTMFRANVTGLTGTGAKVTVKGGG